MKAFVSTIVKWNQDDFNALLCEARNNGAVIVDAIERVGESVPRFADACGFLNVTDLVQREQQVQEVTACAQGFEVRVGVCVCTEKSAVRANEALFAFLVEDVVAEDPVGGLLARLVKVRVGLPGEVAQGDEVGEVNFRGNRRHGEYWKLTFFRCWLIFSPSLLVYIERWSCGYDITTLAL